MGFSTPKPRFNLVDFLAEKATPAARRKPTWKRQPLPEVAETEAPEAEAPEADALDAEDSEPEATTTEK